MIIREDRNKARKQRARRTADIHGTAVRPRLSVYRSLNHIYAQVINDDTGVTIVACNTLQPDVEKLIAGKTKSEAARLVGKEIGKRAKTKKVTEVVFDRSGYVYTGRVQQVADGAREAGLKF